MRRAGAGETPGWRQARRAAHSVAANIAEGWAKRGSRDCARYLDIAVGSLAEMSCTLRLARDRGLLSDRDWIALEELRGAAGALVWGLYRSVSRRRSSSRG